MTAKSKFEEWLRDIEAEIPGASTARIDQQALLEFMETEPTKEQVNEFLRQQIEADQVRRKKEAHLIAAPADSREAGHGKVKAGRTPDVLGSRGARNQ